MRTRTLHLPAPQGWASNRIQLLLALCLLLPLWPLSANGNAQENRPWWDDAVCYEIFVRSFQDSDADGIGDLQGLIDRLEYLNDGQPGGDDLGVTCLWLMPVFPSPSYHGYDVTDYYAIDPDYGSLEDFDRFLALAEERGIRVLLDLPLNHTNSDHPWFIESMDQDSERRDWYIWQDADPAYLGPWNQDVWHEDPDGAGVYYGLFVPEMPDLNYRNPEVNEEARKIASFWLDRGVAGFRFDAVKHLIEDGQAQENTPETHAWLAEFRAFLDEEYPDAFVIGEIFGAGSFLLEPYYDPEQLNAYFQFEIAYQILAAADAGSPGGLRTVVSDALEARPAQPWGTFLTNHDQNRTMTHLGGNLDKAKLAAIALMTLPGLPFIYYGEEIGMTGSKPDPRIRTPMQWSRDPERGFTTAVPWESPQENAAWVTVENQQGDPESLLTLYQRLIELHSERPSLSRGTFIPISGTPSNLLAYLRQEDAELTLVLLNFGAEPVAVESLNAGEDVIAAGTYVVDTLLGGYAAPDVVVDGAGVLTVGSGSSATIPGRTGLIFDLSPLAPEATPPAVASPGSA